MPEFPATFGDTVARSVNEHDLGDLVRVSAVFTAVVGGAAIDPTGVRLSYKPPTGSVVHWVYGVDAEIVKDSTGNYHADINAALAGTYFYRWFSTGTGQAAEEQSFTVVAHQAI